MPLSTSSKRFWRLALVTSALCCVLAKAAAAQTIVPTQAERDAYETGRASARTVLVFQYPQICAIVLERPRCVHDLDLFLARFPRFPASDAALLRAAFSSGDFSRIDPHYREVKSAFVAETERVRDPHAAWLIEAGIASVEIPAALDQVTRTLAAPNAISLARYVSAAGNFRALVPSAAVDEVAHTKPNLDGTVPLGLALDQVGGYEAAILRGLQSVFPPQAYPQSVFGAGPRGDAQLGVAIASLAELSEVPRFLAQPDAQGFVDATFARLIETLPGDATRLQALRADFGVGPEIDRLFRPDGSIVKLAAFQRDLDRTTLHAVLVGQLSAQTAFNAAVYRDPKLGEQFRGEVESFEEVDAAVPGLANLRKALRRPAATDWAALNAAATAIVLRLGSP
jgi:hypothetical protein